MFGHATRSGGIYSGRHGIGNDLRAQIGIVWRVEVIDEIISGYKKGKVR